MSLFFEQDEHLGRKQLATAWPRFVVLMDKLADRPLKRIAMLRSVVEALCGVEQAEGRDQQVARGAGGRQQDPRGEDPGASYRP